MTDEQMREALEHLRERQGELEPGTPAHARTERMIADLERHAADTDNEEGRDTLLESLRHDIEAFEAEHPRLTLTLNEIMMKLSGMGI